MIPRGLVITGHRKHDYIPEFYKGELFIQLKLLYKTRQLRELFPMPPLEMGRIVSNSGLGVPIMP